MTQIRNDVLFKEQMYPLIFVVLVYIANLILFKVIAGDNMLFIGRACLAALCASISGMYLLSEFINSDGVSIFGYLIWYVIQILIGFFAIFKYSLLLFSFGSQLIDNDINLLFILAIGGELLLIVSFALYIVIGFFYFLTIGIVYFFDSDELVEKPYH